jgi:hypothetical protein
VEGGGGWGRLAGGPYAWAYGSNIRAISKAFFVDSFNELTTDLSGVLGLG